MATTLTPAAKIRGEAIGAALTVEPFRARPAVGGCDAGATTTRRVEPSLTSGEAGERARACGLTRASVPLRRATVSAASGRAHAKH